MSSNQSQESLCDCTKFSLVITLQGSQIPNCEGVCLSVYLSVCCWLEHVNGAGKKKQSQECRGCETGMKCSVNVPTWSFRRPVARKIVS